MKEYIDYNNHYPVKEKLKSLTLVNYRTQTLIAI
ncbi:IS3 family transposase [Photorhabdus sp. P32]